VEPSRRKQRAAASRICRRRASRWASLILGRRRQAGHPTLTLVAVALGLMMVMLDATLADLRWVVNGYLLAVATGVITGGKLGDRFGRKRVFLIGVVGFALASVGCGLSGPIGTLVGLRVIAESRGDTAGAAFDGIGVAALSAALFCIVWGIIKAEDHGWDSLTTIGFLAAGVVLLAGFVAWEARGAKVPLIPLALFRSRSFSAGAALILCTTFGLFAVSFLLTLYLQRVGGYTPVEAGVRMRP
jgi:MFS family permease